MSNKNPTPIRVGTYGAFNGVRYLVAGRLVMGMELDGERYFWNEFNLVSDGGETATLVHEEGDDGVEWKMFVLFEPEFPLSASEAEAKRVGDRINLEGTDVRISLVDESRVYHIEGTAPEGVELGDVAKYFNAQSGKDMIVVSWTGDEVEYYRGKNISPGLVASAFNIQVTEFDRYPPSSIRGFLSSGSSDYGGQGLSMGTLKIVMAILVFAGIFVGVKTCGSPRTPKPLTKISAPAQPLKIGSPGKLGDKSWRVQGHAVVEIARTGRLHERHEYSLAAEDGSLALLICGLEMNDKSWLLLFPVDPILPPTPTQAAELRIGQTNNIDGLEMQITDVFQSIARPAEPSGFPDLDNSDVRFGLIGQASYSTMLIRWNATNIMFYRGKQIAATDVAAAFVAR
jgi:Domain of unknown function (DUF4178)